MKECFFFKIQIFFENLFSSNFKSQKSLQNLIYYTCQKAFSMFVSKACFHLHFGKTVTIYAFESFFPFLFAKPISYLSRKACFYLYTKSTFHICVGKPVFHFYFEKFPYLRQKTNFRVRVRKLISLSASEKPVLIP